MADWMTWDGGALTADIVTAVGLEHTADITEHSVEDGSTISDNVSPRPPVVTFEFAQSKMPLRDSELDWKQAPINVRESQFQPQGLLMLTMAAGAAIGALTNAIGLTSSESALKVWTLTAKTSKDRIHEMHDALVGVQTGVKEVSFSYDGLVLSGYYLSSVRYSRENKEGGLCRFQLEAKYVPKVKTASSSLTPGAGVSSQLLRALPTQSGGAKTAEAKEKEVVKKSLLASGLDLGGLGL